MQHDFVASPVARDCGKDYSKVIGTPFKVFLSNGVTEKIDEKTGRTIVDIIDLPGLISSILESRVLHPRKLSGGDLKYIRSALRMKAIEVADVLDVSPEHYSRCEGGTKTLSASSEKFFRMYVFLQAEWKHTAVQERLSRQQLENAPCDPEKAKEALRAFQSVFFEMKIQHIFDSEDELQFSFIRLPRNSDEFIADCSREDGKWQKEPQKQAA